MKNINISSKVIHKLIAAAVIIVLALCLAVSCAEKKEVPEEVPEEEQVVEYKANSPLGIAESYVGKDVKELIERKRNRAVPAAAMKAHMCLTALRCTHTPRQKTQRR